MGRLVVKIRKYHDYVNLNTRTKGCKNKNVTAIKTAIYINASGRHIFNSISIKFCVNA